MKTKKFFFIFLLFSTFRVFAVPTEEELLGKLHFVYENMYSHNEPGIEYVNTLENELKEFGLPKEDYCFSIIDTRKLQIYFQQEDYDKAIFYGKRAFDINKKSIKKDNADRAFLLKSIGDAYQNKKEYDSSLDYYFKALPLFERFFSDVSSENCASLGFLYSSIGSSYSWKSDFVNSFNYYLKAMPLLEAAYGVESSVCATQYSDLARLYNEVGDYGKSISYYQKSYEIYKKLYGLNDWRTAQTSDLLGSSYENNQNYIDALKYYQESCSIYEQLKLKDDTALTYNHIAGAYHKLGNFERAKIFFEKAIPYAETPGTLASIYNNAANNYIFLLDYKTAEDCYKKVLNFGIKEYGKEHPKLITAYINLGQLYDSTEEYDKAIDCLYNALELQIKFYGEYHPHTAIIYDDLANVYKWKGLKGNSRSENLAKAESCIFAAIDIYEKASSKNSIYTAQAYKEAGDLYYWIDDKHNAVEYWNKAFDIYEASNVNYYDIIWIAQPLLFTFEYDDINFKSKVLRIAMDKAEKARTENPAIKNDILEQILPFYYYGVQFEHERNNHDAVFAYSEALRSRGFLEQIGIDAASKLSGVTDADRNKLQELQSQIRNFHVKIQSINELPDEGKNKDELFKLVKKASDLENELEKLDLSISKNVPSYMELKNPRTVNSKDAKKWCGTNRAIVEYILCGSEKIPEANTSISHSPMKYAYCIVITKNKIQVVPLDSNYAYDSSVSSLRDAIIHRPMKSEVTFEKQRNELYERLVKPILPYIKGKKDLLIVPDGNLSFLPFDMLRESSDSDDFGKKYSIGLSPSVSVSMLADRAKHKDSGVLAFGGAWYDRSLSEEEHGKILRGNGTKGFDRGTVLVESQSNLSRDELLKIKEVDGSKKYFEMKNLNWHDLPGTVTELEMLQRTAFKKVKIETQESASEASLKEMSATSLLKQYSILHFACHGYFDNDFSEMSSVLFSEVSGKLEGTSNEDGYLTISEAASLSLNAQMVCLSACQTGLGEIKKGEGLVGLSRAFMVAGSRNVGVTLWSVDDEATAEFMSRMYKKVRTGMTYAEAYRKVKNEFRNSNDYNHPYYWAAFVIYE